jgi:hypothetical protein
MRGFEKICFDPSYVPMRLFEAAPGRALAIKNFFLPVSHFLHQNSFTYLHISKFTSTTAG